MNCEAAGEAMKHDGVRPDSTLEDLARTAGIEIRPAEERREPETLPGG
mgnify:CR=1 FL=1